MSILSESGREKKQAFMDWVNADSMDIPPEIVYPPKADDHGHGHGDDHGHDDHGHDEHGHDDHGHGHQVHEETVHEACAHEEVHKHVEEHVEHDEHAHHGTPSLPQPSRAEVRAEQIAETNAKEEAKRLVRKEKLEAREEARKIARQKRREDWGLGPDSKSDEAEIKKGYRSIALLCGLLLGIILIITVATLPRFGSELSPAVNEVSKRYLEQGLSDTGATNAVAGIILDYRAFDTLGESMVLFTATLTVIFLLKQFKRSGSDEDSRDNKEHNAGVRSLPARVVFDISIPFILLYGIYVVVNGHLSPGGGFSGGTIIGAGLILAHMVFGEDYAGKFISVERCTKIMAGANGIESGIPLGTPGSILSGGLIFPLNICVGLIVACTIYALYHLFTSWKA